MTPEQIRDIIGILSNAITRMGPIKLNTLHNFLLDARPSPTVYGRPKKWIEQYFSEVFFVYGTNGHETVDFANSSLSNFYKLLVARIPQGVIQYDSPELVQAIRDSGLKVQDYASSSAIEDLLRIYPGYQVTAHPFSQVIVSPNSNILTSSTELNFVQSVAFMMWKPIYNKIKRLILLFDLDFDSFRADLSRKFARALIDGENILMDDTANCIPRMVLKTGYTTDTGEEMYCILQPNKDNKRQLWLCEDVCYPDEQDDKGLGHWLAQKLTSHAGINYKEVRQQVEDLMQLRELLIPELRSFLDTMEGDVRPVPISDRISQYEEQWSSLDESLSYIPDLSISCNATLSEIATFLDGRNEVTDMTKKAVDLFYELYEGTSESLSDIRGRSPESDWQIIQSLFTGNDLQKDLETFRKILHPYEGLLKILKDNGDPQIDDVIPDVASHFDVGKRSLAKVMRGEYQDSDKHFDRIGEITDILNACASMASKPDVDEGTIVETDALADQVFCGTNENPFEWISLYQSLMPKEDYLRAVVLGEPLGTVESGEHPDTSMILTPGNIASRLMDFCGNQDRLAERYLLLGLRTDRKACVKQLLELYREADDAERFLNLWNSEYCANDVSASDVCYWLTLQKNQESVCWDKIESLVTEFPQLKVMPEYRESVGELLASSQTHSNAYVSWLGINHAQLNELEMAVAGNDVGKVYMLLERSPQLLAMGYEPQEISAIHQAFSSGLPSGTDPFFSAYRLYRVQKNKNHSVEYLLWASAPSNATLKLLFDIYSEDKDYVSVCWMVQKFSLSMDSLSRTAAYAEALSRTKQYAILSDLLYKHPELWYRADLLENMVDSPWPEIYGRESAAPIGEASPFAQALIRDDVEAMRTLLSEAERMDSLGYSKDLQESIKSKLDEGAAPTNTDHVSVVKRFKYYQGNHNRDMERYLYQRCSVNFEWAIQHLYELAYNEKRYVDVCAYFEHNAILTKAESKINMYMWSLLHTGRTQPLFELSNQYVTILRKDAELAEGVIQLAKQANMQEFSENIQRMIVRIPQNEFEKAVMSSNFDAMQKYVSNPSTLNAMGYSAESIALFKKRLSTALPYGNSGYQLAVRMQMFFGNERAIPFLEDVKDEPRAIKLLLDVYYSTQRWDDVCMLFRDHISANIWNSTYEQRYHEALSKSRNSTNCQLYWNYLQQYPYLSDTDPTYPWKYLRYLIGTLREEEAIAQMHDILRESVVFEFGIGMDILDFAWEVGSPMLRQQTVLFAARIHSIYAQDMTLEQQKALLSINGKLLLEADHQQWIDLFKANGLERVEIFLLCYLNFGIHEKENDTANQWQALFSLLRDSGDSVEISVLTAVTQFALDNNLLNNSIPEYQGILLENWLGCILSTDQNRAAPEFESLREEEFQTFALFWETVDLTPEQIHQVHTACLGDREDSPPRSMLFFDRTLILLSKTCHSEEYINEYADRLLSGFASLLSSVQGEKATAIRRMIERIEFGRSQWEALLQQAKDYPILYHDSVRDCIRKRLESLWPDLLFEYLKNLYFRTEEQEQKQKAVKDAQQLLNTVQLGADDETLLFAYAITCSNLDPVNIKRLYELYTVANKTDYTDILSALELVNADSVDFTVLHQWFCKMMEELSVESVELYSKWWAPLICLQEKDLEAKSILSYLSDDDTSLQYRASVLKLLLKDLGNPTYIGCYLRLNRDIPSTIKAKLVYIRALQNPDTAWESLQECIKEEHYVYALKLWMSKVNTASDKTAAFGKSLDKIYTRESIQSCPELLNYVPHVFQCVIDLNRVDAGGAWKNTSRAVDIATLTQTEALFLDIFTNGEQNFYMSHADKCASLIASMMLRGDFETAKHYIDEYCQRSQIDPYLYMTLLTDVVGNCIQTGTLSEEDDILLRSIPTNGNMRPLEMYGNLMLYAIEKHSLRICARAFRRLIQYTRRDKALYAACIHLYTAIADEESILALYDLIKEYLSIVQEGFVVRVAKSLCVVSACISEKVPLGNLINACRSRISDHTTLKKISTLRTSCEHFLEDSAGWDACASFLIRAATGWWRIDRSCIDFFSKYNPLCNELIDIYTASFLCACMVAALCNRKDAEFCQSIQRLPTLRSYNWGKEQIKATIGYSDELCQQLICMLDTPVDVPGLYSGLLAQTLKEPDEDRFTKCITVLLTVQQNFLTKQYDDNVCFLKEMMQGQTPERQSAVSRIILRKTALASGRLSLPKVYVDDGLYEYALISAEKYLEDVNPTNTIFRNLNSAYRDLGRFMTDHSTGREYGLAQLINMTTLLSQSANYSTDVEKLLVECPAKWKLCLRAAQEMVQGNPVNILTLLNTPVFQSHEWCHSFISFLVVSYASDNKWKNTLTEDNKRFGRPSDWGYIDPAQISVKHGLGRNVYLIRAEKRNTKELSSFEDFLQECVKEMAENSEKADMLSHGTDDADSPNSTLHISGTSDQDRDIWQIPFVAECLERQLSDEQMGSNNMNDSDSTEDWDDRKQRLLQSLAECPSPTADEAIPIYENLLIHMRRKSVDEETRKYCVNLGLALYYKHCERKGPALYPTESSRAILYSLTPCLKGVNVDSGIRNSIRVHISQCLESYQDLAQLTGDCEQDALLDLCDIFAPIDTVAAAAMKNHIQIARSIGQKMREDMTNTDRLAYLKKCISDYTVSTNPVEKGAKDTLRTVLNKEICFFRSKAQVFLTVYEHQRDPEKIMIMGKVANLGNETVTKLVLSLYIDDTFIEQHTLQSLCGAEAVPFSLQCPETESEFITYRLTLKYITQDGAEEFCHPVEGTVVLIPQSKNKLAYYDTMNPAEKDNYIERESINDILEASYVAENGFQHFPNLAIYGMKRSGKSSVLRRISKMFDDNFHEEVRHVSVSCEGITGNMYERAYSIFVKYVLQELPMKFELESYEEWDKFVDRWNTPPEDLTDFQWLDSFYSSLIRQWFPNTGMVVLIDEIERLYFDIAGPEDANDIIPSEVDGSNAQSVLWDVLNRVTQRQGSLVRFILCGSDFFTSKLIAQGDNLTQFFQKGSRLNVGPMEYSEIRDALRTNNSSVKLHDDTIEYLWNISGGLPWHSKMFCNSAIDNNLIRSEKSKRAILYPSDIQESVDRILTLTKDITSHANFGLLSLSEEEATIIDIMKEAMTTRFSNISLDEIMERVSQVCKDDTKLDLYENALRSLVSERMLLKINKERKYQFRCELYRLYLRGERPARFM